MTGECCGNCKYYSDNGTGNGKCVKITDDPLAYTARIEWEPYPGWVIAPKPRAILTVRPEFLCGFFKYRTTRDKPEIDPIEYVVSGAEIPPIVQKINEIVRQINLLIKEKI